MIIINNTDINKENVLLDHIIFCYAVPSGLSNIKNSKLIISSSEENIDNNTGDIKQILSSVMMTGLGLEPTVVNTQQSIDCNCRDLQNNTTYYWKTFIFDNDDAVVFESAPFAFTTIKNYTDLLTEIYLLNEDKVAALKLAIVDSKYESIKNDLYKEWALIEKPNLNSEILLIVEIEKLRLELEG